MKNAEALANRLQEVLLDGAWIANTNFKDQLQKISYHQAIYKWPFCNSIAALTYHVNYYISGIVQAIESGKLEISDKYSFDIPDLSQKEDWQHLIEKFILDAEALIAYIRNRDDAQLSEVFFKEEYGSFQRNIEAQIEHSYYHLGQIVMIYKLIQHQLQ